MKLHYYGLIAGENKRVRPGRGGRFYQDPDYRTMLEGMTLLFRSQWKGEPIAEPVHVELYARVPKRFDATNIIKPVLDALEAAGVYRNDNQVEHPEILQSSKPSLVKKHGGVVVVVTERTKAVDPEIEDRLDADEAKYIEQTLGARIPTGWNQ